jgi:tRNA pseudouridine13 synthase
MGSILMTTSDVNSKLPFLTGQLAGIGGAIKCSDEDFFVEEIPLYSPCGQGTHVYILIEKKGIPTSEAVNKIARAVNKNPREIGFAGQKDAHAVTRQWISIEHIKPEIVQELEIPGIKIIQLERHGNKLKIGHLKANRFVIRVRKISCSLLEAVDIAEQVLSVLEKKGVPNYFGPQRFGNRGNNQLLGKAILYDTEEFIDLFLGFTSGDETSASVKAGFLYKQGLYEQALAAWPGQYADERKALKILIKTKGNKKKAFLSINKNFKNFLISAYQSDIFNQTLAARMPDINRLLTGDMAYKHVNGACFRVEDAAVEQPRCDNFEISPTGPLFGSRMTKLTDAAGEIENGILSQHGIEIDKFKKQSPLTPPGGRRQLRFQPRNCTVSKGSDKMDEYLELGFELDSGCYATTLLREIMKVPSI